MRDDEVDPWEVGLAPGAVLTGPVKLYVENNVDLTEFPKKITQVDLEQKVVTEGDLHGNPLKLLHLLCKTGIFELSLDDYAKCVWVLKDPEFSDETFRQFNDLVSKVKINKKQTTGIRLVGGVFADRDVGLGAYATLKFLEKLTGEKVPVEIEMSSRDAAFLERRAFQNRLIEKEKFESLLAKAYFSHLVFAGYEKQGDANFVLFMHEPVGLGAVEGLARYYGIPYNVSSRNASIWIINEINRAFRVEQLTAGPVFADVHAVEIGIRRPSFCVAVVHGLDASDKTALGDGELFNLNTNLGQDRGVTATGTFRVAIGPLVDSSLMHRKTLFSKPFVSDAQHLINFVQQSCEKSSPIDLVVGAINNLNEALSRLSDPSDNLGTPTNAPFYSVDRKVEILTQAFLNLIKSLKEQGVVPDEEQTQYIKRILHIPGTDAENIEFLEREVSGKRKMPSEIFPSVWLKALGKEERELPDAEDAEEVHEERKAFSDILSPVLVEASDEEESELSRLKILTGKMNDEYDRYLNRLSAKIEQKKLPNDLQAMRNKHAIVLEAKTRLNLPSNDPGASISETIAKTRLAMQESYEHLEKGKDILGQHRNPAGLRLLEKIGMYVASVVTFGIAAGIYRWVKGYNFFTRETEGTKLVNKVKQLEASKDAPNLKI